MDTEGIEIEVITATQGSYIPLTFLPKAYEGRTVRLVLVPEPSLFPEDQQSVSPHERTDWDDGQNGSE